MVTLSKKPSKNIDYKHCQTPRLCFIARAIGEPSEPWIWRQAVSFKRLETHVLTWQYKNQNVFSIGKIPIHMINSAAESKTVSKTIRWVNRLRNLPKLNFFASLGLEQRKLEKLLLRIQPQVILCHFGWTALKILPTARRLGFPLVVHFHGRDLSQSLRNRWYRWSLLHSLPYFAGFVVVGSHQKQRMIGYGAPTARVHIIPCGVPTQSFKEKLQYKSSEIRFIAVCRLSDGKGLDYSIHAFAKVRCEISNTKFFIVGDGPLRSKLEELTQELGLINDIIFCGEVAPDEVRHCLEESDIFVQHSVTSSRGWVEGFGLSITEASATGLPVVATRSGGIEDQVIDQQTGFLVAPGDVNAMARYMLILAQDLTLRERLGKAGRQRVIQEYDTQGQIAKLEDVLLKCCTQMRV